MSKTQKIQELFANSKSLFECAYVVDGIVDEEAYLASPIHTAFLLKETNGGTEEGHCDAMGNWDTFTRDLHNMALPKHHPDSTPLYKTWPNVCLWMYLIHHPTASFSCCTENGEFREEKVRHYLDTTAIINIKKVPGGSSSVYEQLKTAAINNHDFLLEQIEIVDPELIICGGTYWVFKETFDQSSIQTGILPTGTHYFLHNKKLYLEFPHPMWYNVDRKILFAYAKEVFTEVRKLLVDMRSTKEI